LADRAQRTELRATIASWVRRNRADLVIAVALLLTAGLGVFLQSGQLDRRLLSYEAVDVWFEADIARVIDNMSDRWSNFHRANVHPLFGPLMYPPTQVLTRVFGVESMTAVRLVIAAVAGLWMAGFYAVLRVLGARRLDALLLCGVAGASAAWIFWFAIPETHPLGSLSVLSAIGLVALMQRRAVPAMWTVAVSAFTLGVTITNWMAGLLGSLQRRPVRDAMQISLNALAVVVLLWAASKKLMPSAEFFLGQPPESGHILSPDARGAPAILASMFSHTIVMPAIEVVDRPGAGEWPVMISQSMGPGSAGPASVIAVGLWAVLFAGGLYTLIREPSLRLLRNYLPLLLGGQIALHLVFGAETFLYAPNWLPILLVIAGVSVIGRLRVAAIIGASALIVAAAVNNIGQWQRANGLLSEVEEMHFEVARQMSLRPSDPWPRKGMRHFIGDPDMRGFEWAAHALGGSLSPGRYQFGISLWVLEPDGNLRTRSGAMDSSLIQEQVLDSAGPAAQRIRTRSPYYESTWSADGERRFRLDLSVFPGPTRMALAVRAVGPQSAPIRSLAWDGKRLIVNGRWTITVQDQPVRAYLVREGERAWQTKRTTATRLATPDGWGSARLELEEAGNFVVIVEDLTADAPLDRPLDQLPHLTLRSP